MHYRPHEFAKIAGVTVRTLQRWDISGKLVADRSLGNHRIYTQKHINQLKGLSRVHAKRLVVVYCRVSSPAQKPELENQVKAMDTFCCASGIKIDEVIKEVGGGLNFKRKKFLNLIFRMLSGQISTIVVAHKDRLCRFAFELIVELADYSDCNILVTNNESLSPQQEMVEDLMAIIHCFSCRLYGLRRYVQPIKENIDKNIDNPENCAKVEMEVQV
ncbi:MAG: IS607 family transposase [Moorea sp. SIO3I7]|uniref:IS607 family transposase n=1 Tax=unclassified Moorena TaxID=2683338 RepID=UPI0013C176C1|nr:MULTISPECIES: IS607 family transposase [unclassified Moorena]NEN99462.1 IS607 family transposase [Moorena sp. SIO3I7]NEO10480.1 IS607 family transposase [Moorena sp. SIO3I8]NEP27735.1 IS607 family transposase [Moorena sp. SIO3I6]